ncbi:MAG: hypothetical protein ACU826_12075 [Gammaproteobacteria bacterium]
MRQPAFVKIRSILLVVTIFASVGCSNVVTVHLDPVVTAQDCTSDNNSATTACFTPCGIAKFGLACSASKGVVAADSLKKFTNPVLPPVIGWGDSYDDGTAPCPCWEWVSTFSRGYALFDLTKLVGPVESIESASLSWKTKRLKGNSSNSCVKSLYEATGPWKRGSTPTKLLYQNLDTTAIKGGYYGMTKQAMNWWKNPDENFGLMFEPSRANTVAESNSDCTESLEGLSLTVKYRQKSVKWPGQ